MQEELANTKQISTFDSALWIKDDVFGDDRQLLPVKALEDGGRPIENCEYVDWSDLLSTSDSPFTKFGRSFEQQFRLNPDGIHSFELALDWLLIQRESPKLLVVFHGALDREKYTIPRFEFKNTLKRFDGSVLFVSDPSLQTHDSLGLAWYVGNERDRGHDMVATLVREVIRHLGPEKVVITGSSGGGYTALATSFQIEGSLALPFSPQTAIEKYYQGHRSRLMAAAFPNWLDMKKELQSRATYFDLAALYGSSEIRNRVLFVQNTGDKFHMLNHCIPFAKSLGIDFHSGVFAKESIVFDLVFYRDGHRPPHVELMNEYINRAFNVYLKD